LQTKPFAELGLSPKVQAAVDAAGYTIATPIQSQAIPVAVTGRDVLGIAQTGTGKTAAFVLPMITRLESGRARARMPRSLILAPTRELAAQVAQSFEKYGINHKLNVALLIGGVSMDDQVKKLDRGADVLIATPGRMIDHFQRGRLMLMGVEILVIDEADRMLDMGFIPDIEKICKLLPPKRQTLFFSATMPPEITRLVDQFLIDPLRIEVAPPATTAKTITQRFRFCPDGEDFAKREVLRDLIRGETVRNAIIFCNRKRDVAILLKSLTKHGFNAGALHGDMDQKARMETLDAFRAGKILFLAASDVAARGLDIPDVSHVFNFDVPWAGDDYVHRIGRTGRAGKSGYAATLVGPDDLRMLKDIEKATGEQPVWLGDPPTEQDIADSGKRKRRGRGGKPEARREPSARGDRPAGEGRDAVRPPRRERAPRREDAQAPLAAIASAEPPAITGVERSSEAPVRARRPDGRPPRRPREPRRPATNLVPGNLVPGEQPDVQAWPVTNIDEQAGTPRRAREQRPDRTERGERPRTEGPAREVRTPRDQQAPREARPPRERDNRAEPENRAPREDRGARVDSPPREARPPREAQAPREARPPRAQEPRRDRAEQPHDRDRRPQPRAERSDRPDRNETRGEAPTGFADNVPAFLRKTTKVKAVNS
jgi:superfamily II DNA/RNA helicase